MALMAVCSEMSPGLQVPHCDTGQCARPLNQNSPDTGTTLNCTGYLSYSLSSRSTEKVPGIPCRDFRSEQGFKILFVPNPVGTQHQKLYFHFVPAAPRRCRGSNCMDQDVEGNRSLILADIHYGPANVGSN